LKNYTVASISQKEITNEREKTTVKRENEENGMKLKQLEGLLGGLDQFSQPKACHHHLP
jgi:hypothetical protein